MIGTQQRFDLKIDAGPGDAAQQSLKIVQSRPICYRTAFASRDAVSLGEALDKRGSPSSLT